MSHSYTLAASPVFSSAQTEYLTNRPPVPLAVATDELFLSKYQCLLRKQIELCETKVLESNRKAQGRTVPVKIGQVGIRCRHCGARRGNERSKSCIYYPKSIDGIYQLAQFMCKEHFLKKCQYIPDNVKGQLASMQTTRARGFGGKKYWCDQVVNLGVYEDGKVVRFQPLQP